MITRRRFVQRAGLAGIALLAACERSPGQVQAPTKTPRVAYMGVASRFGSFQDGLRELGYVEGQNLTMETRWTLGESLERYVAIAEELVRLHPDVLVATTTPQTRAAKQVTNTIPIVFAAVSDPVGLGFVTSLGRPGGNITGQSDFFAGLSGKRLELLRDAVPGVARVAALWNSSNPAAALEWNNMQEAGRSLGVEVLSLAVDGRDDLAGATERMMRDRVDALIVLSDGLFSVLNTPSFPELVAQSRVPTMDYNREAVLAGTLMSYGPNLNSLYRRAAYYVDRILKGAKPADLPVEQPREFDFAINLKTAQALGLTIPQHVLLQATEVIQ